MADLHWSLYLSTAYVGLDYKVFLPYKVPQNVHVLYLQLRWIKHSVILNNAIFLNKAPNRQLKILLKCEKGKQFFAGWFLPFIWSINSVQCLLQWCSKYPWLHCSAYTVVEWGVYVCPSRRVILFIFLVWCLNTWSSSLLAISVYLQIYTSKYLTLVTSLIS